MSRDCLKSRPPEACLSTQGPLKFPLRLGAFKGVGDFLGVLPFIRLCRGLFSLHCSYFPVACDSDKDELMMFARCLSVITPEPRDLCK